MEHRASGREIRSTLLYGLSTMLCQAKVVGRTHYQELGLGAGGRRPIEPITPCEPTLI